MRNRFRRQRMRIQSIYEEFPKPFWTITFASFIDALGGALIFPFFSLYLTRRFGVGLTQVGFLFGIFSIGSIFGSAFGGALADRMGRKGMVLFGLVVSALSALSMAFVPTIEGFYIIAIFVGLFSNVGGPARQAMVADVLSQEKRAEGYSILRVVFNLAVTIGPMIGGFLAAQSYLLLFLTDAVISLLVAGYVYVALPETKPAALSGVEETESMAKTFAGYGQVLRDKIFILFALGAMLMTMVYMQYNSTLPVYLRDNYQVTEQGYGFLLSLNAGMVVVFQFAITRRIRHRPPMLMMAVGTLLYAFGFSMYGFVETYFMFLLAIAVITVGEMVVAPVAQAIVAKMAPEEMRGRYMAVFGYTWAIPSMVGPLLAGLVMDNYDPRYLWYLAGMVAGAAALLFYALFRKDTLLEAGEMKASEGIH